MRGGHCAKKELRAVRSRACVCHRQDTGAGVPQLKVLIGKAATVDRLAARAIAIREIPALAHKPRDDSMEAVWNGIFLLGTRI